MCERGAGRGAGARCGTSALRAYSAHTPRRQQHRRPESFLICMWAGALGRCLLARHDGSSAAAFEAAAVHVGRSAGPICLLARHDGSSAFEAAAAPGRGLRVSVLHVCGLSSYLNKRPSS